MNSLKLGDIRITPVRVGSYWWDGGAMFGIVPKTLWSKFEPSDELNRIEAGFNCFVVETGAHRILIETGGGIRHDERARDRMRLPNPPLLTDILGHHGFAPDSIDIVINTHLHWDHCGGNTADHGSHALPALPRATYFAQRGEVEHAREQHPRDAVSYRAVNYEPLVESGRMRLLDGDTEIAPGVKVRVTPGHNRDMMIALVRSHGESWCHFADLIEYGSQLTPTWVSAFDLFPIETIANKARLLATAAAEEWWCSFGHDPRINFAKIGLSGRDKWQLKQTLT